jgi:hypothetical protein
MLQEQQEQLFSDSPRQPCSASATSIPGLTPTPLLSAELGHAPSPVLARFGLALVSKRKSGTSRVGSRNGTRASIWRLSDASADDRPGPVPGAVVSRDPLPACRGFRYVREEQSAIDGVELKARERRRRGTCRVLPIRMVGERGRTAARTERWSSRSDPTRRRSALAAGGPLSVAGWIDQQDCIMLDILQDCET